MPDQEFHEVQLTFKKLFFLFMCAVILAGVIFSFGVSVGRGVRNGSGETPSSDVATDTTVPADLPAVAAAKPNDTNWVQALEGRGANPATVTPPPPPEEPTPAATATPTPAPAAVPQAPAGPAAAPATGGLIVQVEAFAVNDIATREVAKLKRKGYPAKVFAAPDGTPNRFKVQVGPFANKAEADKTMKSLRTEGYNPFIKR